MKTPALEFNEVVITRHQSPARADTAACLESPPIVVRMHDETVIEIPMSIARDQLVTLMVAVRRAWE